EAQLRRRLQALIRMPNPPAGHRSQRSTREDLRGLALDLREPGHALLDRPLAAREDSPRPPRELALADERLGEPRRRRVRRIDQRQTAFDQHEPLDALRERSGDERRDRRAARVTDQREARPTESIGNLDRIADVLPEEIPGILGAKIAETMAGQIERDDAAAGKERREPLEASGIVEPAVQREHGQPAGVSPLERRERVALNLESPLERHESEARRPARRRPGRRPALLLERSRPEALADELLQPLLLLEQARARQEQHAIAGGEPGDDLAVLEIGDAR